MSTLRFTKDHEWVRIEGDVAVCGITDYAQKALGDVVYVELPAVGKQVKQGDQAAVVESVKAASEVYAPVAGEVVGVNDNLSGEPAKVNAAPTGDGWFFKIKPASAGQADGLMDEAAYQDYVKGLAS
ncbi:MAG: glycine cleavage system protein GcvH [Alphaproteobacteria bacterium]|nr:glycine cleavage system protein GcvH [Alphaproteobacteria bacterium]